MKDYVGPLSEDDEDEMYRSACLESVQKLLEMTSRQSLVADEESPQTDDAWWVGGAMPRLAESMGDVALATRIAHDYSGWQSHGPILFVYDIVKCDSPFRHLRYVLDAGRPPLQEHLADEHFLIEFSIPRRLSFIPRAPRQKNDRPNLFKGVYASSNASSNACGGSCRFGGA